MNSVGNSDFLFLGDPLLFARRGYNPYDMVKNNMLSIKNVCSLRYIFSGIQLDIDIVQNVSDYSVYLTSDNLGSPVLLDHIQDIVADIPLMLRFNSNKYGNWNNAANVILDTVQYFHSSKIYILSDNIFFLQQLLHQTKNQISNHTEFSNISIGYDVNTLEQAENYDRNMVQWLDFINVSYQYMNTGISQHMLYLNKPIIIENINNNTRYNEAKNFGCYAVITDSIL